MLKMFTTHDVEVMHRDARKRSRANSVILAKPLNKVAAELGYWNWSLLQKDGTTASDEWQTWFFQRAPALAQRFQAPRRLALTNPTKRRKR